MSYQEHYYAATYQLIKEGKETKSGTYFVRLTSKSTTADAKRLIKADLQDPSTTVAIVLMKEIDKDEYLANSGDKPKAPWFRFVSES